MEAIVGLGDTDYLFSPDYVFRDLTYVEATGYVNDFITEEMIDGWSSNPKQPVLISAQTGSGKNYFVTHKLREYAKAKGKKILYISNRVALDYQQKKELAKLTKTEFPTITASGSWANVEEFSNVRVTTYQRLSLYFSSKDDEWFRQFDYVILDECHFFYSDAYFNARTGYIFESITQKFFEQIRIYMSATFEDVVDPLCYYESRKRTITHTSTHQKHYDCTPICYNFPRDFSNYSCYYFSNLEQIKDEIFKRGKKEKWLVFVTNKNEGRKLQQALNRTESDPNSNGKAIPSVAQYLDSESRNSDDFISRWVWEQVKTKGTFDSQVFITTSVLDNGFSIKDPEIKNIVICTSDKTEFLQELGRCRTEKDEKMNLYIRKLDKKEQERRKKIQKDFSDLFFHFCGEIRIPAKGTNSKFFEVGNPGQVIQSLWRSNEDYRRNLIYLVPQKDGTLIPFINDMARWRTCQLERQILMYESISTKYNSLAPSIYKEQWLTSDLVPYVPDMEKLAEHDLDQDIIKDAEKNLFQFLEDQAATGDVLYEEEKNFQEFSEKFTLLYKKLFPEDESVRRDNSRTWKHTAVQNHLKTVRTQTSGRISFSLKKASGNEKGGWLLQKDEN